MRVLLSELMIANLVQTRREKKNKCTTKTSSYNDYQTKYYKIVIISKEHVVGNQKSHVLNSNHFPIHDVIFEMLLILSSVHFLHL